MGDPNSIAAMTCHAGVMEQALNQAQHAQQALQVAQLMTQNSELCQVLLASLEEEDFPPESGTATANAQPSTPGSPSPTPSPFSFCTNGC